MFLYWFMSLETETLKDFLDQKSGEYNTPEFIESDPIQVPHRFSIKEDIEISGFLTATISWGNRKSIINSAGKMMKLMGNSPFEFVMEHTDKHLRRFDGFVHRTFNSDDIKTFVQCLHYIYTERDGLEGIFKKYQSKESLQTAIHHLKKEFFSIHHQVRTRKHLPDPLEGSAAKRINMFLRWMVRRDKNGVDFGIWNSISPSILSCPLDVHTGNVGRKLGLITRKQNDARAVFELDQSLRLLDAADPVKYDFALFGMGAYENFSKVEIER
jgi:uncharacterized protein (TIGR02757 family)